MGTDLDCAGGLIPALSQCITTGTGQRYDPETETILPVTHTLRGEGFDASEDGTGRGTPLVPVAYGVRTANTSSSGWGIQEECTHTLDCAQGVAVAQPVTFDLAQITSAANRSRAEGGLPASTMSKGSNMHVATAMQVRRLTPMECERLQGFPDGYTQIPWRKKPADQCPDGPRYKALGNSWAVPVVRWIGKRIEQQMRGRRND